MHDFTTDPNPRFLYFAELSRPFPQWVVEQPIPSGDALVKKASVAFADPARRLLPITDRVTTFHSALDLFAHADAYPESTFERVKEACAFFDIAEDVAPYADVFAARMEKLAADVPAAPDQRFAIRETLNGVDYKLLPLNDRHEIDESAHELAKMAADNRIHFLTLVPAAVEIVKAATALGVNGLPQLIIRLGSQRLPDREKSARLIAGREEFAKRIDKETARQAYEDALKDSDPAECLRKIAAIDDTAGLQYNYRPEAPVILPSEIVYCGPLFSEVEKTACEHVAVGDVLIPLAELKRLDPLVTDFRLSKSAAAAFRSTVAGDDARDVSVALMDWDDKDRRTLLRLAAAL